MAVMARERWTDERIDERFDRVDADIGGLRMEMRKGFEQIDKRFDQIDKRFEQFEKRFDQIDKRFEQVDKRFEQIDKRFERVDKRFERVDDKFDAMQREMNLRFESVQRNMTYWFISLFSIIVASLVVTSLT